MFNLANFYGKTTAVTLVCFCCTVSAHDAQFSDPQIRGWGPVKRPAEHSAHPPWHPHQQVPDPLPTPTYGPDDALSGDVITEGGELITSIEEFSDRWALHALSHDKTPIETRSLPPYFVAPELLTPADYVIKQSEMVVINPAPGEYVYVMEGARHGYSNTTIAITSTLQGGGAPLHTHIVEESHVLLKGKMRYQLGDEIFEVEGPYVINIPSMIPHAFMNLNPDAAEVVAFFPDNRWEFDIVEHMQAGAFFDQNLDYEDVE